MPDLHHYAEGDVEIIEAGKSLDVYTAATLRETVIVAIRHLGRYHLVIDLTRTLFMDATGLGVLAGALKRVRGVDGSLAIVCADERSLAVFRITGLAKVFAIYPTVAEAVASLRDTADA